MAKDDAIVKNNKGYILIEVLIATSMLFTFVFTFVPLTSLLLVERENLSHYRQISSQLHDKLLFIIYDDDHPPDLPKQYKESFKDYPVIYLFRKDENDLIKGCALWRNNNDRQEEVCLYGYLQK